MFEFTIQDTHFKIEYSLIDDVVACYKADKAGNWGWIAFNNTDAVERGEIPVKDFINTFLAQVNKKLSEIFGEIEEPPEFKTPMDELVFRINNNLSLSQGQIKLTM